MQTQKLNDAGLPWRDWLAKHFAEEFTAPFAKRHERLWDWFAALKPGYRPRPHIEIWPRGGAKSSTGEAGCGYVCENLTRRYALYVCGTQDQADKHVISIAALLEKRGVERALNVYGNVRGWRRQELRTANGFNVSGYGLDTGLRGIKQDNWRPDLIIFDDVDSQDDSPLTLEKKIARITTAILPAGSSDCAVLFLQNKIHDDSIAAQLVDGRADFLHDREVFEEPAVEELQLESREQEDGSKRYFITGGTATWEGQNLSTCEAQINEWGEKGFRREAQHEVKHADGYFFNVEAIEIIEASEVPLDIPQCRAWDLAATEGGGDFTCGFRVGLARNGVVYLIDLDYGQWGSDNVEKHIEQNAIADKSPRVILRLPQDPGQAGKSQAKRFETDYSKYGAKIRPISGDKATRATGLQKAINAGNCKMVRAPWNPWVKWCFQKFREDLTHTTPDDPVDAAADGYNELVTRRGISAV